MLDTTLDEMISLAKRENNNKRGFLIVNRFQAKHIPTAPKKALALFSALAERLKTSGGSGGTLVIGFAETATAIGAACADALGCPYIQTTREDITDARYLFFSEEHSHATEQRLVRNELDGMMKDIGRVILIDDEISTGKTILNIIDVLKREYGESPAFTAASLINGMSAEKEALFASKGIGLEYLFKTDSAVLEERARGIVCEGGEYAAADTSAPETPAVIVPGTALPDARRLTNGREYTLLCRKSLADIAEKLGLSGDIAVIGTEEFMYPAIILADELCGAGCRAVTHSTTRSPIAVSAANGYVFEKRYTLPSFYDEKRTTYIYDLKKYDAAVIITDSAGAAYAAENALINALRSAGTENNFLVKMK